MDMDTKNDGTWTMVYDEGFQVMIGGQVFFAFSKYTASEETTVKDDDDEQTKGYVSDCDETFKGWFFDGKSWGCYQARKRDK